MAINTGFQSVLYAGVGVCWYWATLVIATNCSTGAPSIPCTPIALNTQYKLTDRIVNPYNFTFILQTSACSTNHELLIVIHSSTKPEYNRRRDMMRNTWLKANFLSEKLATPTKIVFFVGKADSQDDQRRIEYESETYRDIVQSDFIDSYQNNTYKAMSFLLWTSQFCSGAKLLLKVDDDVLLRTATLPILAYKMSLWKKSPTPLYIGKKSYATRPNRDTSSKWYLSRDVWPYDWFPTWLQGMVYILSPGNAAALFQAALRTGYMHTDDVFIGICVNKTAQPGQKTEVINLLSVYADPDEGEQLQKFWDNANVPFFHLPNSRLFLNWSYNELYHGDLK